MGRAAGRPDAQEGQREVMRVYIAAPFQERQQAQALMAKIEAAGISVTSSWLKQDDELSDQFARQDLKDVAYADALVALNPDGYADRGTGGRHVEFGYALALGKRIVLVGARTHIFHYLSEVRQAADAVHAVDVLLGMSDEVRIEAEHV